MSGFCLRQCPKVLLYYSNQVSKLRTLQADSLTWATSEQFQNSQLRKLGDVLSNARALPWEPDNLSSSPNSHTANMPQTPLQAQH